MSQTKLLPLPPPTRRANTLIIGDIFYDGLNVSLITLSLHFSLHWQHEITCFFHAHYIFAAQGHGFPHDRNSIG